MINRCDQFRRQRAHLSTTLGKLVKRCYEGDCLISTEAYFMVLLYVYWNLSPLPAFNIDITWFSYSLYPNRFQLSNYFIIYKIQTCLKHVKRNVMSNVFALYTTVQNLEVDTVFCFISLLRLKKGPYVSKLVTQIQIILLWKQRYSQIIQRITL